MHKVFDSKTPVSAETTFDDFLKIDIRSGTIIEAGLLVGARNPSYRLVIDFGEAVGIRKSAAQITVRHEASDLVGVQVLAVVNFPPRQIGKFMSEVLVLGVPDDDGNICLLKNSHDVPNGSRMS